MTGFAWSPSETATPLQCEFFFRGDRLLLVFGFHTTSWTLVRAAAGDPTAESREALAALCRKYWHPVYAFVRSRGCDREHPRI